MSPLTREPRTVRCARILTRLCKRIKKRETRVCPAVLESDNAREKEEIKVEIPIEVIEWPVSVSGYRYDRVHRRPCGADSCQRSLGIYERGRAHYPFAVRTSIHKPSRYSFFTAVVPCGVQRQRYGANWSKNLESRPFALVTSGRIKIFQGSEQTKGGPREKGDETTERDKGNAQG